jgi:hypothetical protein
MTSGCSVTLLAEIEPVHSGKTEHNNRFLPPSPHGYGAASDFARNDKYERSTGHSELHLSRLFDDLGGL